MVNKKFARPTKLDLVYIEDSPDYCTSTNPIITSTFRPEVEQMPTSNRLVAKRPLIAKASKQSLSKKSRKYRSNKSTRQTKSNKLTKASIRTAQRRTLDQRMPKAQRLISGELDNKNENKNDNIKIETDKQDNKLDNLTEDDNKLFKEENQFNGQSSIIPQIIDEAQQELTDEQKEQLNELISKQTDQKEIQPMKQLTWLGTHGRECNRSSLATDSCTILCCGRGYYTERVLVKEKCNCQFRWPQSIECNTCKNYKTIHYCK